MPEDNPESAAEAVVLPSEEWDRILATIATARNEVDDDEELVGQLIDLLPRLKTRESHHGISGRSWPYGFNSAAE